MVRFALVALTASGAVPAVFAKASEAELDCLAHTLYWEAKSEGREGMVAVGWVVLNRQQSPEFPDGLCEVVYQGGETPPCQFSWWCDGKSDRPREADNWALAREVAARLLDEPPPDPTDGALFFHRSGIETPWRIPRTRTARIGGHVFYR
ncbi:MAG TPA: cell wall hydrolase [Pseudomonadales bacterium]